MSYSIEATKGKELMVLKKEREKKADPIPVDDAWWNSVLEDVEALFTATSRETASPNQKEQTQKQDSDNGINWSYVEGLYQDDQVVCLEVTHHNRGGLLVAGDGIQGFVPASHLIDNTKKKSKKEHQSALAAYVGQTLTLKVIECEADRGRIVLSERAAQTDPGSRLVLLNALEVGDHLTGNVTTITDFGVFVDLGGVEGLVHISELSWGRVSHPSEIVSIGAQLNVCILQLDREKNRVALSVKRQLPNPWHAVHDNFYPGQVTMAEITNIVSYGAFARLKDGIDGLIHISELGKTDPGVPVDEILSPGQKVKVCILHIDSNRQRLGLSLASGDDGVT